MQHGACLIPDFIELRGRAFAGSLETAVSLITPIKALDLSKGLIVENRHREKETVGFWSVMKSTLAAFIGVQSVSVRERDFSHGNAYHFIGMGLFLGIVFVLALIGIVNLVLRYHG